MPIKATIRTQALTEKCKDRWSNCNDSLLRAGPAELVPGSGGLAFSPAEVDAPPEDAEGWVEVVEDIPSTGKSGSCIQKSADKLS